MAKAAEQAAEQTEGSGTSCDKTLEAAAEESSDTKESGAGTTSGMEPEEACYLLPDAVKIFSAIAGQLQERDGLVLEDGDDTPGRNRFKANCSAVLEC